MDDRPSSLTMHLTEMAGSVLTAQRWLDAALRERREAIGKLFGQARGTPLADALIDSVMPGDMQVQRTTIEVDASLLAETQATAGAYLELPMMLRHTFYEQRYSTTRRWASVLALDMEPADVRNHAGAGIDNDENTGETNG